MGLFVLLYTKEKHQKNRENNRKSPLTGFPDEMPSPEKI
jgi:hypothetical protein